MLAKSIENQSNLIWFTHRHGEKKVLFFKCNLELGDSLQILNVSSCLCCFGNGQNITVKHNIMVVDVNTKNIPFIKKRKRKKTQFYEFFLVVPCWRQVTEEAWMMSLMWSFPLIPLKRYPDCYTAIFHMLPIRYKKPDSSQVNRMQSGGGGGCERWFSIEGRRKIWWSRALLELSESPYGCGKPIAEIYYPHTKP